MSTGNSVYKGHVQIYLQGKNALIPIDVSCEDQIIYFVGSEKSKLLVRDFRKHPILAGRRASWGLDGVEFASIFNQPAQIEIKENHDLVQIDLHETAEDNADSMLWLGVISNGKMAVHPISWEMLKPIDDKVIAFAALVQK